MNNNSIKNNFRLKLEAAITIQTKYKQTLIEINNLNLEIKKIHKRIQNISNRIQENYNLNVIVQNRYNKYMTETEFTFNLITKLPNEITFKFLKKKTIINIKTDIYEIKEKILNLCCLTGSYTCIDTLEITVGDNWNKKLNDDYIKLVNFINNVFIPTSCKITDNINNISSLPNANKLNILNTSFTEKIEGANISFPFNKNILIISGFFKKDPLHIFRSIDTISNKLNLLLNENIITANIPQEFKSKYFNQLSLRDFMVFDVKNISNKVKKDFNKLERLKELLLSSLVKEFLLSNIQDQRKILTLFLISSDTNTQHLAYLMYDMISSSSDTIKPQFMGQEIYRSLHWSVQKLFKIAFKNVEKYRDKLLDFTDEDIPYKDRIVHMNASKSIKSKAIEKLREIESSKENSKAKNYLNGLLKIPFNVYKKEKIISFLENFNKDYYNTLIEILAYLKEINIDNELFNFINKNVLYICNLYDNQKYTEKKIDDYLLILQNKINEINDNIKSYINNDNSDLENIKMIYNNNHKKNSTLIESKSDLKELLKINDNHNDNHNNNHKTSKLEIKINKNFKNIKSNYSPNSPKLFDNKSVDSIISDNTSEISDLDNNYDEQFKKYLFIESLFVNYIDKWNIYKKNKKDYMSKVKSTLDKCVYGQKNSKKQIERFIAQWINGKMDGIVFGFQGPPGVGKTTLCKKGLAKCLIDENGISRPFAFIPLGGASYGSYLDGHGYTYVGSTWGRMVDILIESKCMNPVIYIDELDKVSHTERGREIIGILTHLTDPSQNSEFQDKYFNGINFDFSKALIVFSYNDSSLIDGILKDRITEVKVKAITKKEKLVIVKDYILPDILNTVGYSKGDILINDENILYIIDNYTYEAGVRKLKEKFFDIVREINLERVLGNNTPLPYNISKKFIQKLFSDKPKVQYKKIADKPHIGLVNGLYANSVGLGGITLIEVMKTPSDTKLNLELTGQQGDVMKESMRCARTIAWNLLPKNIKKNISEEWETIGPYGLHIHCPEASTPKDGPSAGAAITTAILSRLCNIPIINTIAMTGEIDLNGKIHRIGGLESKLEGAKSAGVLKTLIPFENNDDYNKIVESMDNDEKETFFNDFEVITVNNILEVIKLTLCENNINFNNINV
jgi:ATP-dependent Lon protease